MKKITIFLFLSVFLKSNSQTTLAAGDILFTGYNAIPTVGSAPDTFSFVTLVPITATTVIYFTERGYHGGPWQTQGTSEGTATWTCGANIGIGTEVVIQGFTAQVNGMANGTVTVAGGNVTTGLSLSNAADQVIAFQGGGGNPAAGGVTFISGISWNLNCGATSDTGWNVSSCTYGPQSSALPPGLVGGTNAFLVGTAGTVVNHDHAKFNCTGTPYTTVAALRTAIMNKSNWIFGGNTFSLTYTPVVPGCNYYSLGAPEINIQGNTTSIMDGDSTPTITDHTDFGSQSICSGTIVRTFTVQNTGTSDLIVNTPSLSGTHAADFSITANPTSPVTGSGSTTFNVTFNPSASGIRSATVTISNSDADEGTYDFTIQGTGIDDAPNADAPANVTTCDSYLLPALTVGNYFTGSGGSGTPLFAGNNINSSQTIFVYAVNGSCSDENSFIVTINPLANAGFNYSAAAYCVNATDPIPTITGLAGGTFSSTAGLNINAVTGLIDVSASTPNTYTVTYTTAGTCPNSSNVSVTINPLANAGFNYSAAAYCVNATDPIPTITGLAGGTFSSTAGLNINAVTGLIDVSASTPNTYTVTYTTAGTCSNSSNVSVTISALDNTITQNAGVLSANQAGATYQWYECPSTLLTGETNQSFTPTSIGDYKVEITFGVCTIESVCETVTVLVSENFENIYNFSIYPNPTNSLLNINANFEGQFIIVNQLGQTVKTFNVNSAITNVIDLENLTDGFYFISSINGIQLKSQKLIIKK
jgi:hypothetical protein